MENASNNSALEIEEVRGGRMSNTGIDGALCALDSCLSGPIKSSEAPEETSESPLQLTNEKCQKIVENIVFKSDKVELTPMAFIEVSDGQYYCSLCGGTVNQKSKWTPDSARIMAGRHANQLHSRKSTTKNIAVVYREKQSLVFVSPKAYSWMDGFCPRSILSEKDKQPSEHETTVEVDFVEKMASVEIESLGVPAHLRKKDEPLDELRGCVKNNRQRKINRGPTEQLNHSDETHEFKAIRSNIREQAARCVDCGVTLCQGHLGCPLGNKIPKWNDLVFKNNWRQALEQLLQTNNFPEFTGRVCPAPCEGACTLGTKSPAVTIKSIECAIIDYGFTQGWMKPCKPAFGTGKRIAIIGSGPSGLGAAAQLVKVGHTVVVYERMNSIGGLLRYQIPDQLVVDRRVTLLEQEGVRFLTNTEIGKDVRADFLLKENDAIIVCTGSATLRDLRVEGRDAKGICFARDYLEKSQRRRARDDVSWGGLNPANKKVIILGGGDTATDCIATSNRHECETVGAFEILPQPGPERKPGSPWPEWPLIFLVDHGHEKAKVKTESDPKTYSVSTKRFLTTTNSAGIKVLTGLEIVDVDWEKDEKGAWKLVEKADSIRTIECDLCILAMGVVGPEKSVIEQLNLKTDQRSNILTSMYRYDSDVAKVFAAGDCRRGQSLVVWAIHEGRQAARRVDEYLMGKTTLAGPGGIVTASIQHKNAL